MKFAYKNRGYTLLELVVYVSVVAALAVVSIQSALSLTRTFSETKSYGDLRESGSAALERIIKEVRFSSSVDLPNTTFNSSPGRLTLNTTDESGNPKTVEFYVSSGSLRLIDGGVNKGALTGAGVSLNSIIFRQTTSPRGTLIKTELVIRDTRSSNSRSANFYGSAVTRGSY